MKRIKQSITKKNLFKLSVTLYIVISLGFFFLYFGNFYLSKLTLSAYEQGKTDFANTIFNQLESSPCKQIEVGKDEKSYDLINISCLKTK